MNRTFVLSFIYAVLTVGYSNVSVFQVTAFLLDVVRFDPLAGPKSDYFLRFIMASPWV